MEAAQQALSRAGENRPQLEQALRESPDSQRFAMEFLIANMPDRDLRALTADYLLANQRLSFEAWREAPWKEQVDEDTFLNFVLPYANINEGREAWREDFRRRCLPLVADAKTPTDCERSSPIHPASPPPCPDLSTPRPSTGSESWPPPASATPSPTPEVPSGSTNTGARPARAGDGRRGRSRRRGCRRRGRGCRRRRERRRRRRVTRCRRAVSDSATS